MERLEAIAPSGWIAGLAQNSQVFGETKVWTVANPVPDVFKPCQDQNDEAEYLKIGFVSQNLNNPYKGLDILLQAVSQIENKIKIELRLFGHGRITRKLMKSRVVFAQFENDEEASRAYNSCDLIVVPSNQDNFPSVVTEAISCGIPVIGSNIGGISEILNEFDLPTFESGDPTSLAVSILNFKSRKNLRDIANKAEAKFSFKESARQHKLIYSKLI
jgi:glycosyltransferase involved in cell wall biosynthesis